jgi:16S rRNA (cytosine967-C5)-methyltransferase
LTFLTRIPDFAAVDETVSLAHEVGAGRASGYVNAVLRRVAGEPTRPEPDAAGDPRAYWTGPGSHPAWLVERWLRRLGREEAAALMTANNRVPPLVVVVNRLRASADDVERALRGAVPEVVPGRSVPGTFACRGAGSPRDLPGFSQGAFLPMDEAAALPVLALDLAPGQHALDACAGGGGKTALMAASVGPTGQVLALDRSPRAIRRLTEATARLGLASVRATLYDACRAGDAWAGQFSRVLLDAPCSGLGTLSSRPDLRWRRRPQDVPRLARLQARLLERAAAAVKPGGALTYAVCTVTRAETLGVVEPLLAAGGWEADDLGASWPGLAHPEAGGFLLVLPPDSGSTGFFVARLLRSGSRP